MKRTAWLLMSMSGLSFAIVFLSVGCSPVVELSEDVKDSENALSAENATIAKTNLENSNISDQTAQQATPSDIVPAGGATSAPASQASMPSKMPAPADIAFKDKVQSNVQAPPGLDGLVFFDTSGERVSLESYLGKKNVVLVFTEGFAGMLCPFCKTQTSRLVANYDKFAALDTEVLVVYPGTRDHLDEFVQAAKTTEKAEVDAVPFPILLDEDLQAADFFNIKSKLAHPSTFIIDKRGDVRLAYVGADMSADRPSVRAILAVLKQANAD